MKHKKPINPEQESLPQRKFSHIRKRDGRLVPFDAEKITQAIFKAGQATGEFGGDTARQLAWRVIATANALFRENTPDVERMQEVVEEVLLASPWKKTAKAYLIYREQHARFREIVATANAYLVNQYLDKVDWRIRENSNTSYSLQGLNSFVSSDISQSYWLNCIYPPEVRAAHLGGDLHIHDMNILSAYCVGWDLRGLLISGFCGVPGKSESRPARHFRSALGQIVNFFYTLAGEVAGAQAFANFDTLLAPFIRQDGLDFGEVKQALQEFVFNLNVATRGGFQSPFTNLTMDIHPPAFLSNEQVIIGGQVCSETYGEFLPEIQLLNRAFFEVLLEGDARGRAFSFPIPSYNITSDFAWEDPALNGLWEVTARLGAPYFGNFVGSGMSTDDVRSMCCRLRLDMRILETRGGGLFGAKPLTGSIGVVTMNMPRLGFLAQDESDFLARLDDLMDIACTSLVNKRRVIEQFTNAGLYPYCKFYLRDVHQRFGRYWENHFSTIGLVGMNEACLNLLGCDIGTTTGIEFALRVLDHMRDRLQQYQMETGDLFNLEATPAESTCYRLAKLDQRRFPGIICANPSTVAGGGEPFYTNSSQLPSDRPSDDVFEVLDLQDELQAKYTGGSVLHVFLGEAVSDPQAVKRFVRKVCEQYRLPYFTITPTFSICPSHGYLRGQQEVCPQCGSPTEVYSRVVGYYRPVSQWNDAKQAEFSLRRHFHLEDLP